MRNLLVVIHLCCVSDVTLHFLYVAFQFVSIPEDFNFEEKYLPSLFISSLGVYWPGPGTKVAELNKKAYNIH